MTGSPLRLEVIASSGEIGDARLDDSNVVVIDVLRATTVIAHALAAGAAAVIPAAGVEAALELKRQFAPGTALVGGERGGFRVPGFDLGNSPLEYRPEVVSGRTVILASTNGSVVLARCATARRILAASFNTLAATARRMREDPGDWTIICSGKFGRACLEDLAAAGRLVERLGVTFEAARGAAPSDAATDGLAIALAIDKRFGGDSAAAVRASAHGRYLESIGFAADLEVCAAIDSLDISPEVAGGRLVAGPR